MLIVVNSVHYSFAGFRQESSRGEIETTTGYCPTIFSPLSTTISHFTIKWGPPTSVLNMLAGLEVEVVEMVMCVVITLIPVSVELVRAVWLQGGERTGLSVLAQTWPRCRPGQVSSVRLEKVGGGAWRAWWYYCYSPAAALGYLYSVTSPGPQSTHKLWQ